MHLLLAQKGSISEGEEAVDLGQSPADILFLSAADTEISSVAVACSEASSRTWRAVSLSQLKHPMSVDTYIERTAKYAKLIIVRALGGAGYFSYVLETLSGLAFGTNIKIIVLPGDDKADPDLDRFSNVDLQDRQQIWQYLIEGGARNSVEFVAYCEALLDGSDKPNKAQPLLKSGLYWPLETQPSLENLQSRWVKDAPVVAISFYRALVQSNQVEPVDALISQLQSLGLNPLPVYVSSLKDGISQETVRNLFGRTKPDIVINLTGFAVSKPSGEYVPTVLEEDGAIVLQGVLAGMSMSAWEQSTQGLASRDLAMNVALPEVDGRVMTRAVSFKSAEHYSEALQTNIVRYKSNPDGVKYICELAANWVKLRHKKSADRRVAIIMANYPNKDGRLANGVGLDTPASTVRLLKALNENGYDVENAPTSSNALMNIIRAGRTNSPKQIQVSDELLELSEYLNQFKVLPQKVQDQIQGKWGAPDRDPFFNGTGFELPLHRFGNAFVGVQPARGYNIDPKETHHSPDLVPPHGYLAFYFYLREKIGIDAVIHMGKHGNLEWLPGKALALSKTCYPAAILGPTPHIYPFIVNDPGEGTQAKRRTSAVIIDHLTPPLTRAETYGVLKDLEALVDEFYLASGHDPRRLKLLKKQILELMQDADIASDAGIDESEDDDLALEKLDAWLCEMKEMQIRDGLHVFGLTPEGRLLDDLTVALARLPRGEGDALQSLHRALAQDLNLKIGFDPLDCVMSEPWDGAQPDVLKDISDDPWRTYGDTVERIELLAIELVSGAFNCLHNWHHTLAVMEDVSRSLRSNVMACGDKEISATLRALNGKFVAPGPSGAPTRGRPDVLPTGKNFYSVDSRALPTPAAWELGKRSADLLIKRYVQDHGNWPTSFGVTAWGTSNMRTGGDDLAQVLALIGAKPTWDMASRRMTGYEIVPLAKLGRPRVDVTLRISGFFRDAFPDQIALIDRAIRAAGALDEEASENPIAQRMLDEKQKFIDQGMDDRYAEKQAGYRIFGSKPGAYGAGLQALIDEGGWEDKQDFADAYMVWGGYAYSASEEGVEQREIFRTRLGTLEAVVQNQDNREHDLLDSDDYYQFEGGMVAAVETISGERPMAYHNDHSRPEKPVIRSLDEEISRVMRARVINPKWIDGVMRHGYKGAFEMAATVDYMFAFSATTGAVQNHHFELTFKAYLLDEKVRDFIAFENPDALSEMAARFFEAIDRGLWSPKSNSAKMELEKLIKGST